MLIVAGTVRLKTGTLEDVRPHMDKMLAASRAEPGCITYSYALDVQDAELVRVFEEWHSKEDLDLHFQTPHMAEWREALGEIGIVERKIKAYTIDSVEER